MSQSIGYAIRPATLSDLPDLPQIERLAGAQFRAFGLAEVMGRIVTPVEDLRAGLATGRLWVAADEGDLPVGFALAGIVGHNAHLDELDVHPEHGRRGLGRLLVEAVCEWAQAAGFPAVTLTTLRDIPWNSPWYERLGFRVLAADELTSELAQLLRSEIARGLPGKNRVAMLRRL